MIVDLISAASDGFMALLAGGIDDSVADVGTNPEPIDPSDETERQFILLGDIDSDREGGKGEQLERLTVQVITIYRGTQRWKLHELMHQARVLLDNLPIEAQQKSGVPAPTPQTPVAPADPTKAPGAPTTAVGERSPFFSPKRAPVGDITGTSFTPLQDLAGTITPSELPLIV